MPEQTAAAYRFPLRLRWLDHPYYGFHRWPQPLSVYLWAFDIGHLRIAKLRRDDSTSWTIIPDVIEGTAGTAELTIERCQWWELQEALDLIQRIAAGDFSGFNGSVEAAQEFLTTRTKALAAIEAIRQEDGCW